jgi:hypothetical protein
MKGKLFSAFIIFLLLTIVFSGCFEEKSNSKINYGNLPDEEKIVGTWECPGWFPVYFYSNGTFFSYNTGGTYLLKDGILVENWTYGQTWEWYYFFSEDGNTLTLKKVLDQNVTQGWLRKLD